MHSSSDPLKIACDIAVEFEGFRSKTYVCPAGVNTIGYGTTDKSIAYPGNEITKEYALSLLE